MDTRGLMLVLTFPGDVARGTLTCWLLLYARHDSPNLVKNPYCYVTYLKSLLPMMKPPTSAHSFNHGCTSMRYMYAHAHLVHHFLYLSLVRWCVWRIIIISRSGLMKMVALNHKPHTLKPSANALGPNKFLH